MRIVEYQAVRDGVTVERLLRQQGVSHRLLTALKKDPEGLTVDGKPVRSIDRLSQGQSLRMQVREIDRSDIKPQKGLMLSILYEDEDLFVVDKPAGMAVHPSMNNRDNTVANALAALYQERGLPFAFRAIGRLDKNTSGLLVLAKNPLSACLLTEAAQKKQMYHTYLAACMGQLPPQGTIDAPIARAPGSVILRCVSPDGERAVTHFTRLAVQDECSLARVRLETGRTHQIRVHFQYIGHPLVGDHLYNPHQTRMDRHALHAASLTLPQPISGELLHFYAPLPADMRELFGDVIEAQKTP